MAPRLHDERISVLIPASHRGNYSRTRPCGGPARRRGASSPCCDTAPALSPATILKYRCTAKSLCTVPSPPFSLDDSGRIQSTYIFLFFKKYKLLEVENIFANFYSLHLHSKGVYIQFVSPWTSEEHSEFKDQACACPDPANYTEIVHFYIYNRLVWFSMNNASLAAPRIPIGGC